MIVIFISRIFKDAGLPIRVPDSKTLHLGQPAIDVIGHHAFEDTALEYAVKLAVISVEVIFLDCSVLRLKLARQLG